MTNNNPAGGRNLPPSQYPAKGGKLRPSQIITTFGPGAVVDLPEDSVMIAGIDDWPGGQIIREHRLEAALQVQGFRAPAMNRPGGDVPCVRFPTTLVCSNPDCGRIVRRKQCPDCGSDTYPARIIVICQAGHADEFPWNWWAHRGQACTGRPVLKLINQGRTATLADLIVRCDTCNSSHPLSGALGPTALRNFTCTGKRPWLIGSQEDYCAEPPRSVLRGASNVYFSSLLSALSIPPWTNPIQSVLDAHWNTLADLDDEGRRLIVSRHRDFTNLDVENVLEAIHQRLANTTTTTTLRRDEFLAFRNPGTGVVHSDFHIETEPVPVLFSNQIARVVLAYRLREVRVLRGFTRIDPPDNENDVQEPQPARPFASIMLNSLNWLPAIEHRGEGIFIELPLDRVAVWEQTIEVRSRVQRLERAYQEWRQARGLRPVTALLPRRVLVHTLAHLLIRQLSLDCGYSSSSLRERIYADQDMCGLLIYTASADSDGSLGGLVQQGRTTRFNSTMQALLENAQWCSSDPLCTEHDPERTHKILGAACHACSLVSETSCEYANHLLDRALVRDLIGVPRTGFFQ